MQEFNNTPNINQEHESEVSIVEIVQSYLKHWKFFLFSILLCLFIAVAYVKYATPLYQATSKIVIRDKKNGQTGIDLTTFNDLGIISSSANLDNELEVLRSKSLMRSVVDSLNLNVAYYKKSWIRQREIYKDAPVTVTVIEFRELGSFTLSEAADSASLMLSANDIAFTKRVFWGEVFESPWGLLTVKKNKKGTTEFPIIVSVLNPDNLPKIVVNPLSKTSSVVELSIILPNSRKAEDIINTLVDVYNEQVIEDKNLVAKNTINFINERLDIISGDLKIAEKDVEVYKKERTFVDAETESRLFLSATGEYERKISDVDIQLTMLRSIKEYLNRPQNQGNLVPANVGLTDPTIISLINSYNELLLDKNRATVGLKENNPVLLEFEARISSLKDNLLKGIGIAESGLRLTRTELTKQEALYSGKIRGLSTQERESRELYRQKEIKETLYLYLLQKREETGLSLAMATPNAKVIDKASAGKSPVKPKRNIILLAAFLIGLIVPICVIYLINLFKFKVESKEELISIVKVPFLGEIPFSKEEDPFPVRKINTRVAEKFRIVAANLSFLLGDENNKVILVTSAVPGEGKSFVARNLALSLATSGHKTLLIDADMRKSKLNSLVDFHVDKGFARYLADSDIKINDIIVKENEWSKNLHIIPMKVFPPNPAELLASKRLDDLFAGVIEEYDYIIIDTPPASLVADIFRLNQFANASIYVTRMDYTHKASLREIRDLYEHKKLHNISCVLNGVQKSKKYGYEGSGYYHDEK